MKVVFDFDDVIFDTKRFKEILFQNLNDAGYTEAFSKYEEVRKQGAPFSLRSFITKVIVDSSDANVEALYESVMSHCSECINRPILTLMEKLGQENCYIVTHGDQVFQKEKIAKSIGEELVKQAIVVTGSKAEAVKEICERYSDEEIIFVDDKPLFLNDLWFEDCPNLKTVLFNEHGLENLTAEIEASRKEEMVDGELTMKAKETRQDINTSITNLGMH